MISNYILDNEISRPADALLRTSEMKKFNKLLLQILNQRKLMILILMVTEMMILTMAMTMSKEIKMLDGPIGEHVVQILDMTIPKPGF